jgi:hypothetical protein
MSRRKQSRGKCTYCERESAKGGMLRHLATCPARRRVIAASDIQPGNKESLYHLRVQDAWQDDFWLDLEVRGSVTLQELDDYLRTIWLECCGHLSQFSFGGWGGREISKRRRVGQVLEPGVELTPIYDFGTSSETLLRTIALREGRPSTAYPIALMARNNLPEASCIESVARPQGFAWSACMRRRRRGRCAMNMPRSTRTMTMANLSPW